MKSSAALCVVSMLAASPVGRASIIVYDDRATFEDLLVEPHSVDFEGVQTGAIINRPAGFTFGNLNLGAPAYQMDESLSNYYGSPYVSDFLASTHYSTSIVFELPPGVNAIGGEWFHGQFERYGYDGHFALTLEDGDSFILVVDDIGSGRKLGQPDFYGFISDNTAIAQIEFAIQSPYFAVALADNVVYSAPIPEPGTLLLILSGGVAMLVRGGILSRRQRRRFGSTGIAV